MALPNKPKPIKEKFGFVGGDYLQSILDKLPDAITEDERDILRARRSYLTEQQIKDYGLEEEKPIEAKPPEEGAAAKEETAKEKKAREKAEKEAAKAAAKAEKEAQKKK